MSRARTSCLLPRVIRAADHRRSLDSDSTAACQAAAHILQILGAKDLAWENLTTPIGLKPNKRSGGSFSSISTIASVSSMC